MLTDRSKSKPSEVGEVVSEEEEILEPIHLTSQPGQAASAWDWSTFQ